MQKITLREVIDADRAALASRTLGAFLLPGDTNDICAYSYEKHGFPQHRCAIGVVLNDATLAAVIAGNHNEDSVVQLLDESFISMDYAEGPWINAIQRTHDCWVQRSTRIREYSAGSRMNSVLERVFAARMNASGHLSSPADRKDFELILDAAEAWLNSQGETHESPNNVR
jgi:hypothetical protein